MPSVMDELFGPQIKADHMPVLERSVDAIRSKYHEDIDPLTYQIFSDGQLYKALPDEYKVDPLGFENLILNTSRFTRITQREMSRRWDGDKSGLFGEEVQIPETTRSGGRTRRAESGYRINVDYLNKYNIDPKKVLFFRTTQPSATPKPEWYWTTDFFETQKGLSAEISPEDRQKSVTLVASLDAINHNGGLIRDINDDQGIAVRQIKPLSFDQKQSIAIIK